MQEETLDILRKKFIRPAIDVHNFKELADECHLKSVPATVINQELIIVNR